MSTPGWDDFEYLDEHNEIIPNLFIGGMPHDAYQFSFVFNFAGRPTYFIRCGQMVVTRPFNDCDAMPDESMLHEMAQMVLSCIKRGPTLVHCQAGINRSCLVSALALIHSGMTADDAIALIREKRSTMCLSNQTFETWLRNLPTDAG